MNKLFVLFVVLAFTATPAFAKHDEPKHSKKHEQEFTTKSPAGLEKREEDPKGLIKKGEDPSGWEKGKKKEKEEKAKKEKKEKKEKKQKKEK